MQVVSKCIFFFSSRRRHTRYWRDWSSDVCSSDLDTHLFFALKDVRVRNAVTEIRRGARWQRIELSASAEAKRTSSPSEQCNEIGRASCREKCRSRWSPYH